MKRPSRPGCPGLLACRPLCGHRQDVEAYQLARDVAEAQLEAATALYPGDVAIYRAEVRMITFGDWLRGKAGRCASI